MLNSKKSDALLARIREGLEMTRREKLSLIVALSIPSMLAQITSVMMFFIDAAMVGHLGANATASIGLIESSTWLMGSIMGAMGMGFSVQVAHFIGANDFSKARSVFRHALICGAIFSFIIMLIGVSIHNPLPYWLGGNAEIAGDASKYFLVFAFAMPFILLFHLSSSMLKCAGDMHTPSVLAITNCVLDVVFNYIFIYILKMGVIGAAIGSFISYAIVSLCLAYMAIFRSKILALHLDKEPFQWVWGYVQHAIKLSTPIAIQSILMSGAQIVSTLIVAPLGAVAIATNSLAITAESLCYMPGYGIGEAATTLVGQTHGAGRNDLCKNFAHMTVYLGMLVMTFMGIVMFIFAPEMIGVLSPVDEIRSLGTTVLRIEAFAEPFFGASIVAAAACVGAGDTLKPAIINLCSMWFVRLSLAYFLAQSMGLKGVWIAMAIELTCRGIAFLIRLYRGNWMKFQVTE